MCSCSWRPIINKHSKCSLDPSGRSMTFRLTEDTFLLFTPALSVLGQGAVFLYRHQKAWWRHDMIVGRVFRQTAGRSTLSKVMNGPRRVYTGEVASSPVMEISGASSILITANWVSRTFLQLIHSYHTKLRFHQPSPGT